MNDNKERERICLELFMAETGDNGLGHFIPSPEGLKMADYVIQRGEEIRRDERRKVAEEILLMHWSIDAVCKCPTCKKCREIITTASAELVEEVLQCQNCLCMTHTIDGKLTVSVENAELGREMDDGKR